MQLVSIIVPIYNVQPYLKRCISSILEQTYSNIEVILVDDGSTDDCPEICDDIAKKDKRIIVIHKTNGGLSDARNTGLKAASGELIAFVDSDDWVSPYFLEVMHKVMCEQNSDIVECDIIKSDGSLYLPDPPENPEVLSYYDNQAIELLILDRVFHQYVWNKIYKKSLIDRILFPNGKCNEDEFWTYQAFGQAKKISKVSAKLYYYFQHSGSIMGQGYNIRRLDVIEAKIQRQKYIERYYPDIKDMAMANLAGSIIYAGQMSLKYLNGADKQNAMSYLNEKYSSIIFDKKVNAAVNIKQRVWFRMAKKSFSGTCMIKNFFKKGF